MRAALARGGLTGAQQTAALAAAAAGDRANPEIVRRLEQAGAVPPASVPVDVLQGYAGTYTTVEGLGVQIALRDGALWALPGGALSREDAPPARLLALGPTQFNVDGLPGATIVFEAEAGRTSGLAFLEGHNERSFRRDPSP